MWKTTVTPPLTPEQIAALSVDANGCRTWFGGAFVRVEWVDDEPEADTPLVVED